MIFAGPGANLVSRSSCSRRSSWPAAARRRPRWRSRSSPTRRAAAVGCRPATGSSRSTAAGRAGATIAGRSRRRRARPLTLVGRAGRRRMALEPVEPREERRCATGSASSSSGRGLGPAEAALAGDPHDRPRDEGDRRLARPSRDRRRAEEISSPVGIVQGSSEAADRGVRELPLGARADQPLARAAEPAAAAAARRRPHRVLAHRGHPRQAVAREVYERVSAVGIAVVLLLFFIGLSNDIGRLGN